MSKKPSKLIVFTKAPVLGEVKTRLQPEYTPEQSLKLHTKLVLNTLDMVSNINDIDAELCCTPNRNNLFFLECENKYKLTLNDQLGDELGERMAFSLSLALQTYDKVIVIGTDCPELNEEYIEDAFKKLDNTDVVIGPAADGGYVLLGLRKFAIELFTDIEWGTSSVLQLTREALEKLGWQWHELETKHDIDRPEDLHRFENLLNKLNLKENK